ncbi:hypothetical protein [Micromonospora sp. KC723]|uniref:hypothetical protein n=1 Tax=Micromonospora sp. KC723 TaxID=2530381 RepID=UPI00104C5443|nr:hypothetical protein [Micromonospora sp. KC723]TDB74409.1 hypothetical protein E1165_14655 [Micromonospora sp. KC723]
MNWNGVLGSVASVINTALPLFLDASGKGEEDHAPVPIGPATLFERDQKDQLHIGNFLGGKESPTILLNFSTPAGPQQDNLAIELPYSFAFAADPWLQKYADGSVTVGVTEDAKTGAAGGLEALYTFITNTVLGVKDTITAVVNPQLTVEFKLSANNQAVAMTAIGAVAVLGTTYMITARNNAGQQGARAGTIDSRSGAGDSSFDLALPTGVDYSNGIHHMQVQLAINLSGTTMATDPTVEFVSISEEERARLVSAR